MLLYEIILLSVGINTFLNYAIGKPGGEFSPYEIFSQYTVWLSIRRLRQVGLYKTYANQYNQSIARTEQKHEVLKLKQDFNKMLYDAADPFFTWERAVGMCSICTGFWISLITGLLFSNNLLYLVLVIVISHILIRIINKLL